MTHVTNKGQPKILPACTCPLTAFACVKRIYTDMALIEVTPDGLVLREVATGLTPSAVEKATAAPLRVANDCREMDVPLVFNGVELRQ
jgi:acyl CoA:acetate/3-ketoacid CoA transferase beta subunit